MGLEQPNPRLLRGTHWYKFLLNTTDDHQLDLVRGTIVPWWAARSDYGMTLNWPVELPMQGIDKEYFLASFANQRWELKNHKDFQINFPKFLSKDSRQLLPYIGKMVQYCAGFGIFIPPAESLEYHNKLGVWFNNLPQHVREQIVHQGHILAQILLSPKTGLSTNANFGASLVHEHNGYDIL